MPATLLFTVAEADEAGKGRLKPGTKLAGFHVLPFAAAAAALFAAAAVAAERPLTTEARVPERVWRGLLGPCFGSLLYVQRNRRPK